MSFTKPYIFLILQVDNRKMNIKILELIGFVLIVGTAYSFLGMIGNELRWPVFYGCAGGALMIIIYRKMKRKQEEKEN